MDTENEFKQPPPDLPGSSGDSSPEMESAEWRDAQLRTRLLAPLGQLVLAPVLLAVAMSVLLGAVAPPEVDPWGIWEWIWIALWFTPAVVALSYLQARLFTKGQPLRESSLTGLCAMFGCGAALASLAATLLVGVIAGTIWIWLNFALPPEVALQFFLRLLVAGCALFVVFMPSFMVAGALLGLINAAVVHYSYRIWSGWRFNALQTAAMALPLAVLVTYLYVQFAEVPTLM